MKYLNLIPKLLYPVWYSTQSLCSKCETPHNVSVCIVDSGWISSISMIPNHLPVAVVMMVVAGFFTVNAVLAIILLKMVTYFNVLQLVWRCEHEDMPWMFHFELVTVCILGSQVSMHHTSLLGEVSYTVLVILTPQSERVIQNHVILQLYGAAQASQSGHMTAT